ncbi:MAG: cryptochrome/photolyase family protein [bacterium]|nr:cryptochrome/photolyase family protein [bacterium]
MSKVLVLYPNQLFRIEQLPEDISRIILIEEPLYFGNDKQYPSLFHRQKLVMHRASMRRYVKEVLWPAGYEVDYIEHATVEDSSIVVSRSEDAEELIIFDVVDDILRRRLNDAANTQGRPIIWLDNPNFYLTRQEVLTKFSGSKMPKFVDFYKWQRERFDILLTTSYKPAGSKLIHDSEVVARVPIDKQLPGFAVFGDNEFVSEAIEYINRCMPDNYGAVEQVPWPTNHAEAESWLNDFIEHRLANSGMYREAVEENMPWLFHGALSASLNIGLLSPKQIVDTAVQYHEAHKVPLNSLEPFIRDILGWREYYRGIYESIHTKLRTLNAFENARKLSDDWYSASTGLPPVDSAIRNIYNRAYVHEAERTDILGSAMLMCEVDPKAVYQYFNEMMIDGYDWLTVPRVYGFSQCADGGDLAKLIPLYPSSNIVARSHYPKEGWCDIWDGLYARFVMTNSAILQRNPDMRIVLRSVERINEDRKRIIGYRAEDFLNTKTTV